MQWKLLAFSLALTLFWTWLFDTFLFTNDNLFWWIFLALAVVVPLISFIYRVINLMMIQIFMKRLIDDQLHQGWICAGHMTLMVTAPLLPRLMRLDCPFLRPSASNSMAAIRPAC
jgi:hypothetical protein